MREGSFAETTHVGITHNFAASKSRLVFEANQRKWLVGLVQALEANSDPGLAFEFVEGAAPEARLAATSESDGCREHCGCVLLAWYAGGRESSDMAVLSDRRRLDLVTSGETSGAENIQF